MWLATSISVKPFPLVSPQQCSCIAWTATCLLCSSACSAGKLLLWRLHVSHPHHALPRSSGQGQRVLFGNGRAPSAHSSCCLLAEGALRAALPSWPAGRAFSRATGKGSSPWRGLSAPKGLIPALCVWEHPRDPEPCELMHCPHNRNSLQPARQEHPTPQKRGSMEFIAQSTL